MSTLFSNYVLACVKVKKLGGCAPNPCRSSNLDTARHLIHKLSGEHSSPKTSGSASTNTSSATGPTAL